MLTMVFAVAATTMLVAAVPEDGVKEAGARWRQGAMKLRARGLPANRQRT